MPPQDNRNNKTKIVSIGVIVVLIVLVFAAQQKYGPTAGTTDTAGALPQTSGTSTVPVIADSKKYKDGTYSAIGNYTSPAGSESVDISLTLEDDIITAATFTGKAEHPTSKLVQAKFAEGYSAVVVGKPIDSLSLTVVNGSSLAPKGFMDAVSKIKIQAQS